MLIRRGRWIRRRLLGLLTLCIGLLSAFGERIVRSVKIFAVRNGISLDMGAELFASLRKGNAEARGQGAAAWLKFWIRVLLALLAQGVSRLVRSVNYLAPLAAAAVFLAAVQVVTHTQFGLQVVYNGEELGCIADESVFTNAEKQMLGRIVFEDYIKPDNAVPEFTIAALRRKNLLSEDELTDALIRASGNELTEATGLYVEDKFFGAVEDRTRLLKLLDNIKDQYRSEEYDPTETVEFVKEVEARDGPLSGQLGHLTLRDGPRGDPRGTAAACLHRGTGRRADHHRAEKRDPLFPAESPQSRHRAVPAGRTGGARLQSGSGP